MLEAYLVSLTICFIVALIQRKLLTNNFRWLFWLIAITWPVEVAGYIFLQNGKNTNYIFHFFQPIEFTLFSLFFYSTLKSATIRKVILFAIPAYFILCAVNVILFQPLSKPNSNAFMVEALLLVTWAALFFLSLLQEPMVRRIRDVPEIWVSIGVLLFYAGAFFIMGSLRFLIEKDIELARRFFFINQALNILFYGLIFFAFIRKGK